MAPRAEEATTRRILLEPVSVVGRVIGGKCESIGVLAATGEPCVLVGILLPASLDLGFQRWRVGRGEAASLDGRRLQEGPELDHQPHRLGMDPTDAPSH